MAPAPCRRQTPRPRKSEVGPPAARSPVDVGGTVGVQIRAVCVSRTLLRCALVACRVAVVRGGLTVVGGSLAVDHRGHPVAGGLAAIVFSRTAIVRAGESLTYAGTYVALDSCLIAPGGAAIAIVSGAIIRVSVLIGIGH